MPLPAVQTGLCEWWQMTEEKRLLNFKQLFHTQILSARIDTLHT